MREADQTVPIFLCGPFPQLWTWQSAHNESINTRQGDGSLIASRCSRDSDDKSSLRGVLGTGPVTHSMILQFSIGGLI